MKKLVKDYLKSIGCTTNYSGNARIMFINDPVKVEGSDLQSAEECVYHKFGFDLPFQLKTN